MTRQSRGWRMTADTEPSNKEETKRFKLRWDWDEALVWTRSIEKIPLSQITMTLNFICLSSSIVPQETLLTLVFMLQHCFSYISYSHSSKNASVPRASPLNMVINYIDGPICQNISNSVRTNIRFMVSECQSTLLSLCSLLKHETLVKLWASKTTHACPIFHSRY